MDKLKKGMVLSLLRQNMSNFMIRKQLKDQNFTLSNRYLTNLRREMRVGEENIDKVETRGRKPKLSKRQQSQLKQKLLKEDPDTVSKLADDFAITRGAVRYYRDVKFGFLKRRKVRVHALTQRAMDQRRRRSWPLYLSLRDDRWKRWISSDEKKFILAICNNKSKIYYIDPKNPRPRVSLGRTPLGDRGVMVWAAVSANGKSKLHFVNPKVKIDSNYYINSILKPFFKSEVPKLYPDNSYVFHQDSAPSHRAKRTIKWLDDNKIHYLHPSRWLANSPDASPLDYAIWYPLFLRVKARNPKTIQGLKKCLTEEWAKFPQKIINNALKAWPKRLRYIYYAKGSNIEQKLR